MKAHYIACATSFSVDAKTNRLSLFHLLDELCAPSFPLRLDTLCVASLLERDVEEERVQTYTLAVSLNGGLLASFTMSVDFNALRRNRTVNTITGLAIPSTGTFLVSILQKNRVLAQWTTLAVQAGTSPAKARPASAPPGDKSPPALARARPTIN